VTVQFLAFLQDSYREAKSGWMLQIMLVLAVLLILLVFSIGFRQVPLQEELGDQFALMNRLIASNPQRYEEIGKPKLSVDNVRSSNDAEPWNADYTFEFVVATPSPEDMRKATKSGLPVYRTQVQKFLRDSLPFLKNVEVAGGPQEMEKPPKEDAEEGKEAKGKDDKGPPLPKEVRYTVTTKGTVAEDRLAWRHGVSVLFAVEIPYTYISLREGVYLIEKWLVNGIGIWVLLFVAVVVTAGFVPNMLAKGSLDLLVSKPIGRMRLLLYKYTGGLLFVLILTTVTVLGVWAAIGVRSGIWTTNFLAIIPVVTLYFAVLYAFSTLAAVLTRSTLVAILMTGLAWGLLWGVGKVNDGVENRQAELAKVQAEAGTPQAVLKELQGDQPLWGFIPKAGFPVFTALHAVLPRTFQMDDRLGRLIAEGVLTPSQIKKTDYKDPPKATWIEIILVSFAGIVVLLAFSAWRFSARDY
jgi:ABC-type transport system involved in multi-copper enzyme maturation permease subunit